MKSFFAFHPDDTEAIRLEKFSAFLVAGSCCLAGIVWALMYYLVFGWGLTAFLPILFVLVVGVALVLSHFTRNHHYAVYAQILCIMYITALLQWSIGGIFDSGLVLVWSFVGPMTALLFFSFRKSGLWFALFLLNLVITVVFDGYFASHGQEVSLLTQRLFFLMNLGVSSLVVFVFAGYFVTTALGERERANRLLLNVLPRRVADTLKSNHGTIADRFESVTVLFADIVGSTPHFADMDPAEVVDCLNELFTTLDDLAQKHGLEKLRTIGDNYMAAAGVPEPRADHAQAVARFALDMLEAIQKVQPRHGRPIQFRIGMNSGPLVAGVIGKSKFHYDVWGDTVNVASRMESHGEAGRIQLSESTYNLLKDEYNCEARGLLEIKGKGKMQTWFLVGKK